MKTRPSDKGITKEETRKSFVAAEVLQLLKQRDRSFLESLFNEVNPYLTRVSFANGISTEDVKDLIHQTWETFFSNLDKFEGRSKIRTFICGILFNKIREYRRFQKRVQPEEDASAFMDHSFTEEGWWKTAPSDPYRLTELKQAADFVKECMEGLSEHQMAAFIMKEVEEEESENICNVLGVNVSNLRVLLFRAKDKLRTCLEGKVSAEQVR